MAEAKNLFVEKLQSLRGMVDLLPHETIVWQKIETTAQRHFKRASVSEIRTPLLEVTDLFARGIGEATDVVGKEMYSFSDKGGRNCTLRPEGTASVVRAAIQHGLTKQGSQRFWYSGPMFRYERPQAGRQRQFHQLGLEFLGFSDPRSDVEAISIAWDLLSELGIGELKLELNSLGDKEDRVSYRNHLVTWLEQRRDLLDEESRGRLEKNPLRILDSKNPKTKELLLDAPKLTKTLGHKSLERFEKVQAGLNDLEIPFQLNPSLVRGLDYYSHTAFEITSSQLGAQATVCGGGRYDGLVEQLGGPATSAIGWALGMERLVLLLSQAKQNNLAAKPDIYIVNRGIEAESLALVLTRKLRSKGQIVEIDLSGSAFGKQLKRANRSGAELALLIGEDEAAQQQAIIKELNAKNLEGPSDKRVTIESLLARFA